MKSKSLPKRGLRSTCTCISIVTAQHVFNSASNLTASNCKNAKNNADANVPSPEVGKCAPTTERLSPKLLKEPVVGKSASPVWTTSVDPNIACRDSDVFQPTPVSPSVAAQDTPMLGRLDIVSAPFALFDIAASYLWVGPLVVLFWRNTWYLCDQYIFPNQVYISSWVSLVIGYTIVPTASSLQHQILSFSTNCNKIARNIMMRVFSYVLSVACVNQWRGLWYLQNVYIGVSLLNTLVIYVVASSLLVLLRCCRVAASPPVHVPLDIPHMLHYKMTTFFKTKPGTGACVLDSIFTVFIIGSLCISVWSGLWDTLNNVLYPGDRKMSAIFSLVISYGLALPLLMFQQQCKRLSFTLQKIHWLAQLIFEDAVTMLYVIVCISHWRGFWMLCDIYTPYIPMSFWICHVLSFTLLALSMASNAIQIRGCERDGALPGGQGVVFDVFWISHLRQAWKSRKTRHLAQHAAKCNVASLDLQTASDVKPNAQGGTV